MAKTIKRLFSPDADEMIDSDAPMKDEDEFMQSEAVQSTAVFVQTTLDELGSDVAPEQFILAMKRVAKTMAMAEQGSDDY